MQDIQYLESLGGKTDELRKLFTAKQPKDGIKRLQEHHSSRLRRAIETCTQEAPIYGGIDKALAAAEKNVLGIQARELAASGKSNEEIMEMFKAFGLENMLEPLVQVVDGVEKQVFANIGGKNEPVLTFNKPLFDEVFIPLVVSYADMRAGKLFNDRNTWPRYKYTPSRMTLRDTMVADIVTSRVQRMASEMGYADDDKQSFKQMAYYGICFNFPQEAYYREEYETRTDDGKVKPMIQREGVRFVIPHPTRHFWDRSKPLHTLNTDTGVSYCGYWDIMKWRDVKRNKAYWNTDRITYGGYDLFTSNTWKIYTKFYPCQIVTPNAYKELERLSGPDRIAKEQSSFLKDEDDATITLAVLFDKLVPSEWGLFDYDKPVWMRFIYANFDCCIHAEVLPYSPPAYVYLDRYDANKTVPQGIGLQLSGFQQLLGNFLTQHFLSVKQNIMRVAWVDTNLVPESQLHWIKRLKDKLYQGITWLTYKGDQKRYILPGSGKASMSDAITYMQNPQVSTAELAQNINLTLMVLERLLGFTAQEIGASATHEQSATEHTILARNSSVNLEFMGTGIDSAWAAKKRLLYTAFYCYGADEVFAEVADLTPEREAALKELGFEVEKGEYGSTHHGVKGKKGPLTLDSFMSDREGVNRLSDSKLGIAMLQALGVAMQQPELFAAIGVKGIVELLNRIWKLIGMPDDFRIKIDPNAPTTPQAQQEQFLQVIDAMKQKIVEEAVTVVGQQMKQAVIDPVTNEFMTLKQTLEGMQAHDQLVDEAIKRILPVVELIEAQQQPLLPPIVPEPQPPIDPNATVPVGPAAVATAPIG